jgi:hypothetical protein
MTDTAEQTQPGRWIEYLHVDSLKPHPDNPKGHALDALVAAVERFGYTEPILVCERTGWIASGHGRVEAVRRRRENGDPPPDGVTVNADGLWLVPVVRGWSSEDDAELRAYLVATNHLPRAGGWVADVLEPILDEMAQSDRGLGGTGFTSDSLDGMLAELGATMPPGPTDAAYADRPERGAPAEPRQAQGLHEVGLMFQEGSHREYLELLARLRAAWDKDMASPMVVLRAMRLAAEADA